MILGETSVIGLSTHTIDQVDAAMAQPLSYVAIGPVFGTTTKDTGYDAVGLEVVQRTVERARRRNVPTIAIGGITLDTAPDVLRVGAASVAVINDLLAGGRPEARVRAYLDRLMRPT